MKVIDFINEFKEKKIQNTKVAQNAVSEYIRKTLEVKDYIPFREKRVAVETVVQANITVVDGVKKTDSIDQYIGFVVTMLKLHTNLEFSEDPIADYDLLAQNNLLSPIIEEFRVDYDECDILLKMALTSELEDNNLNFLVGRFLNGIFQRLDDIGIVFKNKLEEFNIEDVLGPDFKSEDLTQLKGFLDIIK